jgi:hypothetical protein
MISGREAAQEDGTKSDAEARKANLQATNVAREAFDDIGISGVHRFDR